jgi:HAD superfamily hydrolase (TIGR01509 family)
MDKIKAVIFDFDGTLADSLDIWRKIDIEYFKRFGYEFDPETVRFGGMSFSECAAYVKDLLDIPDSVEKIMADWVEMSSGLYMSDVALKPYARETVEAFKKAGYKLGMGTSNNQSILRPFLEKEGLYDYFDVVLTCCEAGKGKPAPDVYLSVAEKLGVEPDTCIVFEDTIEGVLAGKNAGMFVYAVEDPAHAQLKNMIADNADKYIEGFEYFKRHFGDIARIIREDTENIL